jgi:hypothetical protein
VVLDTPATNMNGRGDAELTFRLNNLPSTCGSPIFLIRVPAGKWIATGAVITSSNSSDF